MSPENIDMWIKIIISALAFLVLFCIVAINMYSSKCPICGSEIVECGGLADTKHCTECPWSEYGPDFEFVAKYKAEKKKAEEANEKMLKIAEEVIKSRHNGENNGQKQLEKNI